tara:strand:+ start:208 stop:561 length:354 start_codon:yes stop_codon:yes gene_type:complete
MFDLPSGSKEQVIADFLQPEYQPDLEDPIYKGLEFLLNTHLPDGNYYVWDTELNHTNQAAAEFVRARPTHGNRVAQLTYVDVTHDFYTNECKGQTVFTLCYDCCPFSSGLVIHFIKE